MSAWWNNLVRRPLIRDIVRMAGNRNQPVPPRVFSLRSRITPETGNSLPPCPVYSFNRSTLDFCQYLVGTRAYRWRSHRFREIPTINRTLASLNIYQASTRRRMFRSSLFLNFVVLNFLVTYTEANECLNGYAMNFNSFCNKSFLPHW